MEKRNWAEELPTGARSIDSTNECLQFVLEQMFLSGLTCQTDGPSCAKIEDIIRFLTRKFDREEAVMRQSRFPRLNAHAAEHAMLLERLEATRRKLVCGAYDQKRVFAFLTEWAVRHATAFDRELGRHLASRPGTVQKRGKSAQPLESGMAGKKIVHAERY